MKNVFKSLAIAMMAAVVFNSCNGELGNGDITSLSETSADEAQASAVNDEIITVADEFLDQIGISGYQAAKSAAGVGTQDTVTIDDANPLTPDSIEYPLVATIDFGTAGYTTKRGNVLKGIIIVTISKKLTEENAARSFKLVNFTVNGNSVKGIKVVTYKGLNADDQPYWTIATTDTVTLADGGVIINTAARTRTRTSNNDTPRILWDDSYTISGGSTGTNVKGKTYVLTISSSNPLALNGPWPFFVSGKVTIVSELSTVSVDYGDGTKDNKAVATFGDKTKEITLRR